jgi:hypothetical protein
MSLEVSPTAMVSASGQLSATQSSLASVLTGWAPTLVASPPSGDLVSAAFAAYISYWGQTQLLPVAEDGVAKLAHGAQVLVPVAQDYDQTDGNGGTLVYSNGRFLTV